MVHTPRRKSNWAATRRSGSGTWHRPSRPGQTIRAFSMGISSRFAPRTKNPLRVSKRVLNMPNHDGGTSPTTTRCSGHNKTQSQGDWTMRFLSIYKHPETGLPPTMEEMTRMGKLIEEWTKAGALLGAEGCLPSAKGARVRRYGDKFTVTDGPFAETTEVVGGFALLQANSKAEAIELLKTFLNVAGDGECELRQLYESSAAGPEFEPKTATTELRSQWEAP